MRYSSTIEYKLLKKLLYKRNTHGSLSREENEELARLENYRSKNIVKKSKAVEVFKNGEFFARFDSMLAAAEAINVHSGAIYSYFQAKNRRKPVYGKYTFKKI